MQCIDSIVLKLLKLQALYYRLIGVCVCKYDARTSIMPVKSEKKTIFFQKNKICWPKKKTH